MTRRTLLVAITAAIVLGAGLFAVWRTAAPPSESPSAESDAVGVVHAERSGELDVVLRTPGGTLQTGRNTFTIEFRAASDRALVDVGTVRASANMVMPGMVMSGGLQVTPASVPGRYEGTAEFGMAGTWQMVLEWDGPAGRGSVTFEGAVQ